MAEIESESKFLWKFILNILLTPITLVMVLFKKKQPIELLKPFINLFKFIFEPKFTIAIIMINILIHFIGPYFVDDTMFMSLVNYPADILNIKLYYRFITSGFLHANLSHLFGNILGIFIFGRVVERKLRFLKTSLIYFGAMIISSAFSSAISLFLIGDSSWGIGASGALMGLVAVAILINPFYVTYELIIPLPIMFTGWLTIYADISGILNPIQDGIGHFAHLGGYLSVTLMAFILGKEARNSMKKGMIINLVTLILFAILYFYI